MIILVILYNRPEYTKDCLAHLAKAVGIGQHQVFFQIDHLNEEVVEQAHKWTAAPSSIVINKQHLGCNGNVYAGLSRAFEADDTVAVVEDDILVSSDWLNFISRPEFNDPSVLAVCTFRKHKTKPVVLELSRYLRVNDFNPWGWLTWRDRWEKIKNIWPSHPSMGWAAQLNRSGIVERKSIIQPAIGRTFNCGIEDGAYCTGYRSWKTSYFTPFWHGNLTSQQ